MTIQLELSPEVVNRLNIAAGKKGLSLDAYLTESVIHEEDSNGAVVDESEKRCKRAAAGASILDIRKRVKPDPEGWTSRDYINFRRH
jgi:hypothetical protein